MFDDKLNENLNKLHQIKEHYRQNCVSALDPGYDFDDLENKIRSQFDGMTNVVNTVSDAIFDLKKCGVLSENMAQPMLDLQENIMQKVLSLLDKLDISELDDLLEDIANKTCEEIEQTLDAIKDATVERISNLLNFTDTLNQLDDYLQEVMNLVSKVAAVVNCVADSPTLHSFLDKFHPDILEIAQDADNDIVHKVNHVKDVAGHIESFKNTLSNIDI